MAHRVRHDLLHAPQRHLRHARIADGEIVRQVEQHRRRRDRLHDRAQRRGEIDGIVLAHPADDAAHVAQQILRDALALFDVLPRLTLGEMTGYLEIERQRGEVMADGVVQVARDAQALGRAAADAEELGRDAELGVGVGELLPRARLAARDECRERAKELEREVGQGGEDRRRHLRRHREDDCERRRLDRDPDHRPPERQLAARLRGDDDEQDGHEAGRLHDDQHQCEHALGEDREQRMPAVDRDGRGDDDEHAEREVGRDPPHRAAGVRHAHEVRDAGHDPRQQTDRAEVLVQK